MGGVGNAEATLLAFGKAAAPGLANVALLGAGGSAAVAASACSIAAAISSSVSPFSLRKERLRSRVDSRTRGFRRNLTAVDTRSSRREDARVVDEEAGDPGADVVEIAEESDCGNNDEEGKGVVVVDTGVVGDGMTAAEGAAVDAPPDSRA